VKPVGRAVARRTDYQVVEIDNRLATPFVKAHHYAKSTSHRAWSWGLVRGGELVGVAQFLPPLPPAARKVSELASERGRAVDPKRVIALTRLVIAPGEPQNAASICVAPSLRKIKRDRRWQAVVTFADSSAGHTGRVYLALNAEAVGFTEPEVYWVDPVSGARVSRKATVSRTSSEMKALGLKREKSLGKYRYVWWM
jgi:hypothetical protein